MDKLFFLSSKNIELKVLCNSTDNEAWIPCPPDFHQHFFNFRKILPLLGVYTKKQIFECFRKTKIRTYTCNCADPILFKLKLKSSWQSILSALKELDRHPYHQKRTRKKELLILTSCITTLAQIAACSFPTDTTFFLKASTFPSTCQA